MPEPNQVKWRGIRPVDPPEDIPVTARKLAPAVADRQAYYCAVRYTTPAAGVDCTLAYTLNTPLVPATDIWIIESVVAANYISDCHMVFRLKVGVVYYNIGTYWSIPASREVHMHNVFTLNPLERIACRFQNGGPADNLSVDIIGYCIKRYT